MKVTKVLCAVLAVCMLTLMFAGCAPAAAANDPNAAASTTSTFVMLIIIFVVFYFFMIRPEKKRKKQAEDMRNGVEVGDKITTIGGLVGRVVHVTNDKITFETGEDRVRIEVVKWAISSNDGKGSKEKVDSEEVIS